MSWLVIIVLASLLHSSEQASHPSNITLREGQSIALVCAVNGNPTPTVQWYKDGLLLNTSANPRLFQFHGSNSLVITDLMRNDGGLYACNATNNVSSVISNQAYLTVNYPPKILVPPTNRRIVETSNVSLTCYLEGKPVPNVTWLKDGTPVIPANDSRISVSPPTSVSNTSATITITNVNRTDEGSYSCQAVNDVGNDISSAALLQLAFALDIGFANPGASFTATKGHSATLDCVVYGTPEAITWYRDGRGNLPGSTRRNGINTIAELTLYNVQEEDSGAYTCTASNNFRTISTQMTLVVKVALEVDMGITIKNKEYSAELSNKSSLQFQNLSNTLKNEISSIYKTMNGFKEVQVLGFSNATTGVASRFRVVFELKVDKPSNKPPRDIKQNVTNTAIEAIKKGVFKALKFDPDSLVSYETPPPPRSLTKEEVKHQQISIAWEKPEYHQSYSVTGYEVQYKEFDKEWKDIRVHGQDVNDYVINDLRQDTNYLVRIVAVNIHGQGPPTDNLELRTTKEGLLEHIWNSYKWLVVVVAGALFILLITWYCLCCRKRRRPRERENSFSRRTYDDFVLADKGYDNRGLDLTSLPHSRFREIPRDQIMIGEKLGSGQFGLVTRGYLKQDQKHCAIKMLKANASDEDNRDLLNELDIMSSVEEHPNIINLIGACTQGGHLYVVVELAEHGSLLQFLHKNQEYSKQYKDKVCTLSEDTSLRIGLDIARGIEHLARHRCVHRDLAARNVLLGTNMTAKLSDFGLARDIYERGYYQQLANMKKLPAKWMSVEAIETMVATKESDIWSFGVLLWEIYTGGKIPYPGLSVKELLKVLKKGARLNQPIGCSDQMYAVMMSCWNSNPHKRPTIEHLIIALDEQLSGLSSVNETNPAQSSVA